jgi:Protein of unknown function (DUF2798)
MSKLPRRYAHFLFGIVQSALTSAVASAIASAHLLAEGTFVTHWLRSALLAWLVMLPVVLFAAPFIRKLTLYLTADETA